MQKTETHRRIPYGAWVVENHRAAPSFYRAHSLSTAGIRLLASDELPQLGDPLALRLLVENERRVLSLAGEVVGHEPAARGESSFAVRFLDVDPECESLLAAIAEEALDKAIAGDVIVDATAASAGDSLGDLQEDELEAVLEDIDLVLEDIDATITRWNDADNDEHGEDDGAHVAARPPCIPTPGRASLLQNLRRAFKASAH